MKKFFPVLAAVALVASGSVSRAERFTVSDPSEHASAATALKVHAGDTIALPGDSSYMVLNKSFLSQNGNLLTAIKPGIVGVECTNSVGALATTMAVFVLPEKIGEGNIYIKKDTSESWNKASAWLNVDGTAAADYPHLTDDIAIIPDSATWKCYMPIPADCVLGGLYFGRFVNAEGGIVLRYNSLTFRRSDGKPVMIQACSNNLTDEKSSAGVQFGDGATTFIYESDTIFDGGWDGVALKKTYCAPSYKSNSPHEIKAGVTLTFQNFPAKGTSMGSTFTAPSLKGAGTVWNRSAANIRYSNASDEFTGVIRDSSHGNDNTDRSGPTYFHAAAVTNASAEAYGFVCNSSGAPSCSTSGAGMLCTGWDPSYNSPGFHGNYFPEHGLTLVNSTFRCGSTENTGWGAGIAEVKHTEKFTIGRGFSYVYRHNNRNNKDGHPINWFETDALVHQDKGTIRFDDYNRSEYGSPQATTNNVSEIHGVSSHLVGGSGNPLTSENYPIIPWMVTPSNHSNNKKLAFTCFDAEDRICDMMTRTSRALDAVVDAQENIYVNNQSIKLTANRTVNSLWLYNPSQGNGAKNLGSGLATATLTVTSGGVILSSNSSGIGTQDRPTQNGKLVLGDASHPGYVFAEATTATTPNGIYAEVTAPGGLVFGYTGYALLAGDQTGIDDELVVNAGTLDLGSQDKAMACTLDVPVRILANATVKLNNAAMSSSDVYFDDIAGYTGKIELNAAETRCRKLFVRDTPEETEWTALPAGTYGASGSGAENVDDTRFSGTGILTVSSAGDAVGAMIIVM